MLKKLPIKNEYLLIAGTILLFLLCYQLAFKKTIEVWQINKNLKTNLNRATDLSDQPAYLERKNGNLSKILNLYKTDTINFRSNTISIIATIAAKEQVKLSEVPLQDPIYHTDQFIIQKLNFFGDYFSVTEVFKELELSTGLGVIRSAEYKFTKQNSISHLQKKLTLEIYLETSK